MEWLLYEGEEVYLHKLILEQDQIKQIVNDLGKKRFDTLLKYMYLCYHPESPYINTIADKRRQIVYSRYVSSEGTFKEFEENSKIKRFIEEYRREGLDLSYNEQLFTRWKEDVDNFIQILSEIPYYKTKDGEKVSNLKEKSDALKTADQLVDHGKKLEAKIAKENLRKQKKDTRRLFDRR